MKVVSSPKYGSIRVKVSVLELMRGPLVFLEHEQGTGPIKLEERYGLIFS